MNKLLKKRILIISISLALLLLINIGVSYSYYLGKVIGNESDTTLSLKSSGIIVQYENNSNNIAASNVMPGWRATKNFNVSSNISESDFNTGQSLIWYELFLYVVQNDFPSNFITYTLSSADAIIGNGQVAEARNDRGISAGIDLNGISLGVGNFALGSNKHDYSITFNYFDNGSEYGNYPNRTFSIYIGAKIVLKSEINIELNGGTIEGSNKKYVGKGGTIILPVPIKEGYIFSGWETISGNALIDKNSLTVNDDVINISALWSSKIMRSTIILNLDGGTSQQDVNNVVSTGEIFILQNPTKDGYVFRGWSLESGESEISGNRVLPLDDNVKIKANWESVVPKFTYTGTYTLINDTANNWRIKFLTSGTLTFQSYGNADNGIDLFLVGGGGNGARNSEAIGGAGGGGGYTRTIKNISIALDSNYSLVVGAAVQETSAFNYRAAPGKTAPGGYKGGNGGSGGGIFTASAGSDGNNGGTYSSSSGWIGGKGQRSVAGPNGETGTTREFGESSGTLYSKGGGGQSTASGAANTGNGGGGHKTGSGKGGSGIIIIRNKR